MEHSSNILTYSFTSFDLTALYDEYAGYNVPNTILEDKENITHVMRLGYTKVGQQGLQFDQKIHTNQTQNSTKKQTNKHGLHLCFAQVVWTSLDTPALLTPACRTEVFSG